MYKLKTTVKMENGGGGTSNYEDLENKPQINGNELIGNKTSADLGLQPAGEYLTEVPSEYKTKAENDELYQAKGEYLTQETDPVFTASPANGITSQDITNWNNKSEFSGDYDDLTNKPDLTVYSLKTQTGSTLEMSINSTTYVMTVNLKDINNNVLSTQTVDLPLETMVVNADYDSETKEIVLTLQSGATTRFSVADLVSGLQTEITTTNKLSSDLVDDTLATNKFVTSAEKTTWNGKQDTLVSGTNIKTINSTSVLGSGDITTEQVQYSTMPTAGADNLGKIVQYTGADTQDYTQGHFYIVVSDGESTPTYSWQEISFGGGDTAPILITGTMTAEKLQPVFDEFKNNGYYMTRPLYITDTYSTGSNVLRQGYLYATYSGVVVYYYEVEIRPSEGDYSQPSKATVKFNGKLYRLSINSSGIITSMGNGGSFNRYLVTPFDSFNSYYSALTINNQTSYTPTSDYNPSTKKYTDDTALAKVVADKLTGTSAPTTSTVGYVGQQYTDTTNNNQYVCTAVDNTDPQAIEYTWVQVNGGGSANTSETIINENGVVNAGTLFFYTDDFTVSGMSDEVKAKLTYLYKRIVAKEYIPQVFVYRTYNEVSAFLSGCSGKRTLYFTAFKQDTYGGNLMFNSYKVTLNITNGVVTGAIPAFNDSNWNSLSRSGIDDIKTATGYDTTKTQVLKNINGTLTWVND